MIIGIYGYIGSGKTTVGMYLQLKYKFKFINADKIANQCLKNIQIINYLYKKYPNIFYKKPIDKIMLFNFCFKNKKNNFILNKILWPFVEKKIKKILKKNYLNYHYFVIEAIGLNYLKINFDYILFIKTRKKNIFKRIQKRDNKSILQIKKILNIQNIIFRKNKFNKKILNNTNNIQDLYNELDKFIINVLKKIFLKK